jgi:DNA mismatch endonuclease, patch repair protein
MMEISEVRRRTMQAVKSRNTSPELLVRRLLYSLGYRYRLHRRDLPGCPDLVFNRRKKVIFIHGCFWHGHDCQRGARVPKSNRHYWIEKVTRNRQRDAAATESLIEKGWTILILWECELKERMALSRRLQAFLR